MRGHPTTKEQSLSQQHITYTESFDDGYGGWTGQEKPGELRALELVDGTVTARSPFMLDANHAPPGGGYLHILFILQTSDRPGVTERYTGYSGTNRFLAGGYPTDFTDAKMTLRLKGDLEPRGSELVLLAQATVGQVEVNHVLTGQPLQVTPEWSEQTVTLAPDERQWLCLGSRHDLNHQYGYGAIKDVLRDVNFDIILVLFPVDVMPAEPIDGDPDVLRAGRDYAVDESRLAEGHVTLDEVSIEFAAP